MHHEHEAFISARHLGRVCACWVIAVLALGAPLVHARQEQPSSNSHVHILAAGGLLGQLDGMPEYPAGAFDLEVGAGIHPYGGLEGLIRFKNSRPGRDDLVLVTGNNLPRNVMRKGEAGVEPFLARLRALGPSAVGVGPEDFLRGLDNKNAIALPGVDRNTDAGKRAIFSSGTAAGLFVDWLQQPERQADRLPFLLSNAAVRLHQPGLNRVLSNGFLVAADAAASVSWIKDASVDFPCRYRDALKDHGDVTVAGVPDGTPRIATLKLDKTRCRAKLSWSPALKPGSAYQIEIHIDRAPAASFELHTDRTLTNDLAIVPGRPELPIIVALIDPHVQQILGASKWRWHKNEPGAPCGVAECEIVLLKPLEALDTVLGLVEAKPTPRAVALLSQLTDKDTTAVLQRNQRVRFVVLPPDSQAVGRAAPRVQPSRAGGPPYSGDLGYGAILNSDAPAVTQVWIRPEWFAESAHEIDADITPGTGEIRNVRLEAHSVHGFALCSRPPALQDPRSPAVQYFLEDWSLDPAGKTIYQPDAAAQPVASAPELYAEMDPGVAWDAGGFFTQGTPAFWRDVNAFAAVALDAMRSHFHSDLAVLPTDAIDEGWVAYLREDAHAPPQVSRVLLERLLFRAGTIVNVRLSAAELADAIGKISKAGGAGVSYCFAGLGNAGCDASGLKPRDAMINGRRLNPNRFYTMAMPESVALENGLAPLSGHEADLAAIMDDVLARSTRPAVDTCASDYRRDSGGAGTQEPAALPMQIERVRANDNHAYLIVKPADISFNATRITEPAGGTGLFNKLAIPGSGARPSRRTIVNLTIDAGIIDKPRWALRVLSTLAYGRNRVNGQESVDPNASVVALRGDWKLPRGRLFGGAFWESQFANQSTDVTPSVKGVTGPTLTLLTLRRDYKYVGGGYESEKPQIGTWLSIDPLRFTAGVGTSAHEHVDIAINGERLGLLSLVKLNPTGLLNQYFAKHPELSSDSVYAFVDESLRRARLLIECTPRVKLPMGDRRTAELSFAAVYRRFVGPNSTPLAERQSATMKLTLAVPLYGQTALNLSAIGMASQVNGIEGWYVVWQPAVGVSIPVIASRRAGWVW